MLIIAKIIYILIGAQTVWHFAIVQPNGNDENRPIWFFGGGIQSKFQFFMEKSLSTDGM